MKIVEDMRHQQLQHEAPTARNGDGDPASPEKRQAAEHKRAPAKTVKVSVLSDGSPKSVLKNTNRWCAHGVAPAGPDREIQTLVTDITEGQKEDGDVDVFLRETLPASSSSSSSSSPSPSPSPSSPLVEPAEEERVKPVDKGTSQPRPVTPATEPEPEDTGLTVTRYKVSRVHTPRDDNDDDDDDDEEDEDSLGLYEELVACVTDGESHYITTHEIQLTELSDEEEGRELGADLGEDTQLYSFVDYAPFVEAAVDGGGGSRARGRPVNHGTRPVERDPLSSDESLSKTPSCGAPGGGGPVYLSIKTTSRAINDLSSDSQEKQNKNHPPPHPHHHHPHHHQQHHQHHASARPGDTRGGRRYPPRGAGALRVGGAKCFIAAPGRFHFGRALKGREAAASSGGASSSALSELDDADKEVRHFTGRSFKSLAYPCLGALHLSSSSETSEGLQGANQQRSWSALVDLKCAKLGMDQLAARQNPTPVRSMDHKNNNTHTHTGGYKGIINNKTITLNNNNSSSSTTQQIELLQQGFGRAHGGVFTLTETVNFRCNVESSRMYGGGGGGVGEGWGERRANFAQKSRSSASGSRSSAADGVTDASLGRQGRGLGGGAASGRAAAGCTTAAMEDTHKKAIFASSLLKNVISKKMQFEEERKMERGEICEKEGSGRGRERPPPLQRQGSRFSEAGSEINPNIVCLDELGDMVDTSSCDTVSDCLRREKDAAAVTLTPAPETRVAADSTTVSDAGAGVEPARRPGAFEAATNSTLPRSQNSAFRSWRDGELQFQKERKSHKTLEETSLKLEELNERPEDAINAPRSDPGNDKLKKMSHLFVPTIQIMPDEGGEAETHLATVNYSMDGADSRRRITTSKSPEIKINLRVKDNYHHNKKEPFGVASKLRPHHTIGGGGGGGDAPGSPRAEDSRCQALVAVLKGECADKVPHFMVRDIRDNKGKLQTPIHQVRDVRKLVKSSYHFVSLDNNNDTKSNLTTGGECHAEQKKPGPYRKHASVSPIVIKCQSVNTNSNGKQSGNRIESFSGEADEPRCETDMFHRSSPEGAKGGYSLPQRPLETPNKDLFEWSLGSNTDTNLAWASCRQDKASDGMEQAQAGGDNHNAFRKLQAAVKSMEELYVFDRNEWKRKSQPRPPHADSHALSVTASDKRSGGGGGAGGEGAHTTRGFPPNVPWTPLDPTFTKAEDRDVLRPFQRLTSYEDKLGFKPIPAKTVRDFSALGRQKATENRADARAPVLNPAPPRTPGTAAVPFVPRSPKLPVSVRVSRVEAKEKQQASEARGLHADQPEDYLAVPLGARTAGGKRVNPVPPSASQEKPPYPSDPQKAPGPVASPEPPPPAPTLYSPFPLGMVPAQPQVFCFSPAMSPAPASLDPFQATQRRMLLDPTTGNYYLVDTPVRPTTRRLFDPETGQYVDVPVPQHPITPVPMSMPQMALGPAGAYGQTYMFYPGFMPGPLRALTQPPQLMCVPQPEAVASDSGEGYTEAPYYLATGMSPQLQMRAPPGTGKQPVVSITSQQGPRIVAPPSFDGTTMSFVVEHR